MAPNTRRGQACVKGTGVTVSIVLDNLAAGVSQGEIPRSYPSLRPGSIQTVATCLAELDRFDFRQY